VTRLAILATTALLLLTPLAGRAQNPPGPPPKPGDPVVVVPIRVQVSIARYQGEKRISNLPYTMLVNAAPRGLGQVRMGADIPVVPVSPATPDAKTSNYQYVGTEIDCVVRATSDDRYSVELTISEKSIYAEGDLPHAIAARGSNPALRSFRSYNTLVLRDGQSTQFAVAADRVTGEVVRVEVSLHSAK
jgi:hypothetical protein